MMSDARESDDSWKEAADRKTLRLKRRKQVAPNLLTPVRSSRDFDSRQMAPGLRERAPGRGYYQMWVEGNGLAPVGWVPWDYEQEKGYRTFYMGPFENPWREWDSAVVWSFDEVGVYPFDYSDEQEDELTGVAPCRYVDRRGCWDWEPDAWIDRVRADQGLDPLPTPEKDDTLAKAFEEDQRAHEAAVAQQQAEEEAAAHVRAIRRNVTAMRAAARAKIKEHVANGVPGKYAVEVRKENQTYRIDYEIRDDGKAYVTKKKAGWVPMEERR